jgi:hypothetical protein
MIAGLPYTNQTTVSWSSVDPDVWTRINVTDQTKWNFEQNNSYSTYKIYTDDSLAAPRGSGKTTLLMQMMQGITTFNPTRKCIYLSGEEYVEQLAYTANRINTPDVLLHNETDIDTIATITEEYDVMGIDSAIAKKYADKEIVNDLHEGNISNFIYADKYDISICIEVAEHIDKRFEDTLIENICNASRKHIMFSASDSANGTGHINLHPIKYWMDVIEEFGFREIEKKEIDGQVNALDFHSKYFNMMKRKIKLLRRE